MAKVEIDLSKIKEALKSKDTEPEKLVVKDVQFFLWNKKALFVMVLENKEGKRFQCRMVSDTIYEEQIRKSFGRLKALQLPKEEEKDVPPMVEKAQPEG